MKWPQHRTPPDPHRSTATYNFVPLPEKVLHSSDPPFAFHDRLLPDRLHGWIDLTIKTETPLYTRCAYPPAADPEGRTDNIRQCEVKQEHYHHGNPDEPWLPGSSLRGAIRSLVEIIAYARLSRRAERGNAARMMDQRLVHRAVADQETPVGRAYNRRFLQTQGTTIEFPSPNVCAGYLHCVRTSGEWYIQPAKTHLPPGASHTHAGFIRVPRSKIPSSLVNPDISQTNRTPRIVNVYVAPAAVVPVSKHGRYHIHYAKTTALSQTRAAGLVAAKLVPSGEMQNRHHHTAVYEEDGSCKPIYVPAAVWRQFDEDRRMQRGLPCRQIDDGDPVFYLMDRGKISFLGPTLFFRVPYENWTGDFLPDDGSHALDLAEAIFGTVNGGDRRDRESTEGAHRGRVRFEDARCTTTNPFLPDGVPGDAGRRFPGVLSAPKPTSYQQYLVQDVRWDQVENAQIPEKERKKRLQSYVDPPGTTVIRGFKRYWHHREAPADRADAPKVDDERPGLHRKEPEQQESQFTRIRPVRAGTEFKGRIHFENLTEMELGALLWALELPDSCRPPDSYRHHLGMGKALGMGSVKITPRTTLYDPVRRWSALESDGRLDRATQDEKLNRARLTFEQAVVAHHNQAVRAPPVARLWDIPRLAALKCMLEWTNRPAHQLTGSQKLADFKKRRVLPPPDAVAGAQAGAEKVVDADLPAGWPAAPSRVAAPPATLAAAPRVPAPAAPGERPYPLTDAERRELGTHLRSLAGGRAPSQGPAAMRRITEILKGAPLPIRKEYAGRATQNIGERWLKKHEDVGWVKQLRALQRGED